MITGGANTITYNKIDNTEVLTRVDEIKQMLLARSTKGATPDAEQRVGEAVGNIARGAAEGDEQLRKALDLLQAGKVTEAVPLLQAVAEDKTARIGQDSKLAAAAYRNLGAIAGLAQEGTGGLCRGGSAGPGQCRGRAMAWQFRG